MFTAAAAAVTLSAAPTAATGLGPGFYFMIALLVAGVVGTATVGWQNYRQNRRLRRR